MAHNSPADPAAIGLVHDYSIEMTGKDVDALNEASALIPQGTRVNVTFLGNEDLDMRVGAATAVVGHGFVPVPHLSARRLTSMDELEASLAALQQAGATEHIFAVGGDPAEPMGPFPDSLTLIRSGLLQKYGVKEVSIAGYPEGHPDIATDVLWQHLEDKAAELKSQGLGCVILTQFAFDADTVASWIADVRSRGIDATIRIGTPGPAGIKRLLNFAKRFGIGSSAGIVKKYGFSLTNLMGTAGPDRFVTDLARLLEADPSSGDVKLHMYAFGGLKATAEWADAFAGGQH